jgi:hypothetical protein
MHPVCRNPGAEHCLAPDADLQIPGQRHAWLNCPLLEFAAAYNPPTMPAVLRNALFWLLMLVVPLQGIAGTVMQLHAPAQDMMRMASSSGAHGSDMAMHAAAPTHAAHPCAGRVAGCDDRHTPGMPKCGLSAVCGLVAAPALQSRVFILVPASQAPQAGCLQLQVAFCTGAPERPPRFPA